MLSLTEAVFWRVMLDVAAGVICGGAIGLDRQLRGKPAGMRTCIIVVLTTALFATLGNSATESAGDPSRVVAGIVTGVGFLGAGVIFTQRGKLQGVTTAALIWSLAAIGVTIGFGYPLTAIVTTTLIISILTIVERLERRFPRLRREGQREEQG